MMKDSMKICYICCYLISICFLSKAGTAATTNNNILRIGYVENALFGIDMEDAKVALELLLGRMVEKKLPEYKSISDAFTDLDTALERLKKGELDMLAMTIIDYLEVRHKINVKPAFVSVRGENPETNYSLLINGNKKIETLQQLRNKQIIVPEGIGGDIALMWLDTMLLERSLPESAYFFKSIKRGIKTSQIVLPVFFGQLDVCIIQQYAYKTLIALNPQLGQELTTQFNSPGFLLTIIVFRKDLEEDIQKVILEVSDAITDYPEGRQMMMLLRMSRFSRFKPGYLNNIEKLYEKHKVMEMKLKKNQ
jgi:ABC-type phosphate/phosphonate transport system substrate-binding protein